MRWEDLKFRLSEFWAEFKTQKTGLLGLAVLVVLVSVAILAPFLADPTTIVNWHRIEHWEENPRGVPPVWINYFSVKKRALHYVSDPELLENKTVEKVIGNTTYKMRYETWEAEYDFTSDLPPSGIFIKIRVNQLVANISNPVLFIYFERPDEPSELSGPIFYTDITNIELKVFLHQEEQVRSKAWFFAKSQDPTFTERVPDANQMTPERTMLVLFAKPGVGMESEATMVPLRGKYKLRISIFFFSDQEKTEMVRVVFQGRAYGLLGTDTYGRDIYAGLVWGVWVALAIGFLTSLISIMIGLIYGVTSAYLGGKWDEVLQRLNDIEYSMPVLPLLIMMAAAWRPSIWNIVILLAIFSWPGFAKIVRSMALQIKEQPFVEAAKAAGASGFRIVVRHIAPQILPYTFAVMALGVPGAILTEAGLSFLGLGDPTIPTWGQILHDANMNAAAIKGMWWWVLPPGVAIAIVGLTFALIGMAMDAILNPKMRKYK